jgi:hypothetical protein
MKKTIILGMLLLSASAVFSQIKVLEVTHLERLGRVGINDIYVQKEGNQYTFFYKNIEIPELKENSIRNFSFKNIENDYEGLYKIITNAFAANPLNDVKLELPNDFVWLHFTKLIGKTVFQFITTNKVTGVSGISEFMTIDDVKKLFEKV